MPILGIEMRAITAVGGATAAATAAALRGAASAGGAVGAGVGEGDGVAVAIARTVRGAAGWWAGEWASPAAGMLASRTRRPEASRTTGPRLIDLCSHPLGESQSSVCEGAAHRSSL